VADFLDAIETTLIAILSSGRGSGGSFTTDANARALTPSVWLRTPNRLPIRDLAVEDFDRRFEFEWLSLADVGGSHNDEQQPQYRTAAFNLNIGYVYGPAAANAVKPLGTETRPADALSARRRALNDGERIARAMTFPDIFLAPGSNPALYNVERDGATEAQDFGEGRLLGVTRYRIEFQYDANDAYTP